ncbi:MAG: hypothetical protein EAZ57_10670 [Cytophagales bacterium]|nr:MAG: hypothetical protein EAZ67_11275 [Cytophagales bacterium]TAF59538.1 MAG: hypothetical protein EAZ57_10670 [Cytophagales bacterium]
MAMTELKISVIVIYKGILLLFSLLFKVSEAKNFSNLLGIIKIFVFCAFVKQTLKNRTSHLIL